MKLWIGAEISAEIADAFRKARGSVEAAINKVISEKDYGIKLNSWDCIVILRNDNAMKEILKYSPKNKEMDFRLRIHFDKFNSASSVEREALIFEMLERSLVLLKDKGVDDDGLTLLKADVRAVGLTQGWFVNGGQYH